MNAKPTVSIICPVFNREAFLQETIDSVRQQTFPQWELIIIDDGSADASVPIAQAASRSDTRILSLRRHDQKKGAPACRNIGMQRARGEYLVFLDSDDLLADYALKQRVEFMQGNPGLSFAVFPQLICHDSAGDSNILINVFSSPDDDLTRFLTFAGDQDVPWVVHGTIWRASSLREHDIYWDEALLGFQDVFFHLQALLAGFPYRKVEAAPDSYWRHHQGPRIGKSIQNPATNRSVERATTELVLLLRSKGLLNKRRKALLRQAFAYFGLIYLLQEQSNEAQNCFSRAGDVLESGPLYRLETSLLRACYSPFFRRVFARNFPRKALTSLVTGNYRRKIGLSRSSFLRTKYQAPDAATL